MKQKLPLTLLALLLGVGLARPPGASGDPLQSHRDLLPATSKLTDDPPLPKLSDSEKSYLIKLARTAVDFSARTGQRYDPGDIPRSLRDRENIAYITCRLGGKLIKSIAGEGSTLARNITLAALHAVRDDRFLAHPPPPGAAEPDGQERLAGVKQSVIELEVLGPGQVIRWGLLKDVSDMLSPGVHGLAARVQKNTTMFKPSVGITRHLSGSEILRRLLDQQGWLPQQVTAHKAKVVFYRFRSVHLLEWENPAGYVELFRCAQPVPLASVTRERLDGLIDRIGKFMLTRQLKNGFFSYEFDPVGRRFVPGNNGTRQAAAIWAMTVLAQTTGDADFALAALKGLDQVKLQYLGRDLKAACAVIPGLNDPVRRDGRMVPALLGLGQNAMFLLATLDLPDNQALAPIRDKLVAGVLAMQRLENETPEQKEQFGSFKCYYSPHGDGGNVFYFPGEALLALMKTYQQTRNRECLQAVERAFAFYKNLFETTRSRRNRMSFSPWQIQTWARAYDETGKEAYRDFIFAMADFTASFQAEQGSADYPDLVGGFINDQGFAGIGTAAYLEGMVEAHRIAVKCGDVARAGKYRRCLLLGARFLDQLTFKPPDAFYCLSRSEVLGGLKFSVLNPTIRIDNLQHGVLALIGIRRELFPK